MELGMRYILCALALLLSACVASASGRVALLVGNGSYARASFDLRNPGNDARALAAALGPLGFETRVVVDADRATLEAAVADFAARAAGSEMALFFFAGHGVQMDGENRLLTADLATLTEAAIRRASISLDAVRDAMEAARPGLGLIVLDACRNNPLADDGRVPRGLARASGGAGLLIAYATDPGNVAYDGSGPDSVFTTALLQNLATPGLDVRLMFGRVRQAVVIATAGRQVPWVEEAVLGEHALNPAPPEAAAGAGIGADVAAWRAATAAGDAAAYRGYLEQQPDGLFRRFAEERLVPAPGQPPPADPAALVAAADPAEVADALDTLGFLSATRGAPGAPRLAEAFTAYARQMGGPSASVDGLYLDAAQVTVLLAAGTAQRLRTDIGLLSEIETARGPASRARAELAALAPDRPDAAAALPRADAGIAAIRASEAVVQARLDQSRSFYAELVARGGHEFRPYLQRSLAGLLDPSRSLPGLEGDAIEDAARFVRHATADGSERPEGSFAWLTDFLPAR
jgi:hypothetical protein